MFRVYSVRFYCNYDMAWYPFDIQTCNIEMILDGVLGNYADLLPGGVNFTGPKELTQYFVQNYKITKNTIKTKAAVTVSMTLGRRLLGTFLTIFFPTILLNLIGHATNFFKEFFFEVMPYFRQLYINDNFPILGSDNSKFDQHVSPR